MYRGVYRRSLSIYIAVNDNNRPPMGVVREQPKIFVGIIVCGPCYID